MYVIAEACSNLEATCKPDIIFIISGKRHHIKMIPKIDAIAHKSGNVDSGTVIDTEICSPYYSDFVSQNSTLARRLANVAPYSTLCRTPVYWVPQSVVTILYC